MKTRNLVLTIVVAIILIAGIAYLGRGLATKTEGPAFTNSPSPTSTTTGAVSPDVSDRIHLVSPQPEGVITSPLKITGEARGNWFFEASFPVMLTDWDGRIIAEHYAEAKSDWMTMEFVPFESTLTFTKPPCAPGAEYCKRGFLILKRDNPSGLPEHDAALEIAVKFQ